MPFSDIVGIWHGGVGAPVAVYAHQFVFDTTAHGIRRSTIREVFFQHTV